VRLRKSFEVDRSRDDVVEVLAQDDTLVGLFPDAKTEIVASTPDRKTTRTHYRALGREGVATFHFTFLLDGNVRFEKVCDGRVWRELKGELEVEECARGARWRAAPRAWCRSSPSRARCRASSRTWRAPCAGASSATDARLVPVPTISASDGVPLYVEVHGEGLPVVLSCAYVTTHENWRPQVAPLVAAGARVALWDYRGHGLSGAPADPAAYSMRQVVDDLGRVLDLAAPDRPAVLGGLSFGGLASLHFALARPERVRALVLVGSGPGFKNPDAAERWMQQVERSARALETRGFEPFVAGKAAPTTIGRRPELPAARAAARAIAAQDPRGLALFGRHIAGPAPSVIDELPRIDCPVLVLVGEDDPAYLRAAEVMAAKLPRAERHVIPGAGHISNLEAADAFNALVIGFLERLREA
jgi:pimeloyl-ACP methyl ester carboxylesterase